MQGTETCRRLGFMDDTEISPKNNQKFQTLMEFLEQFCCKKERKERTSVKMRKI